MTNTPMSEQEKELVEAVRAFIANTKAFYGDQVEIPRLESAIKAYDPTPEPVPIIPAWEMRADHLEKLIIQLQEQVVRLNAWQIQQNNIELGTQMFNQGSFKGPY